MDGDQGCGRCAVTVCNTVTELIGASIDGIRRRIDNRAIVFDDDRAGGRLAHDFADGQIIPVRIAVVTQHMDDHTGVIG